MRRKKRSALWVLFAVVFILGLLFVENDKEARAVETKWWKIAPSTCTIQRLDQEQYSYGDYGTLAIYGTGYISTIAFCPVLLPDDASMNLLRVRTFQNGGLPSDTDARVYLRRMKWDGSITTLATANMDPSDTYDDASMSVTVDNEDYQYVLRIYLYQSSIASSRPQIDMIEIRYQI